MSTARQSLVSPSHRQLIAMTRDWALRRPVDLEQARRTRQTAILHNHQHYRATIPAYRRLAEAEGVGVLDRIEPIAERLMSTDDVFKSYQQRWLDQGDFGRMTAWLSEIHHRQIAADLTGVTTIDGWVARLGAAGVRPVYSSGTSGIFSFVPRDEANWALTRLVNTSYLLPLFTYAKLGTAAQRQLVRLGTRLLSPEWFAWAARRSTAKRYDGVFLDFKNGRTGMQSIGRELAPVFRRHSFLYETELTASALRGLTRGALTEADRQTAALIQAETVTKREQNFTRLLNDLRRSVADGQLVFIFGAPFQLKAWCEHLKQTGQAIVLPPGSMVLFGGGWKSFTGERIPREALVSLIADRFGLPPPMIVEGYSMTEINVFMVRCDHGRFHLPPLVEPLLFDEALEPIRRAPGQPGRGQFGFLDPFAIAYPGFIISGDLVHLVDDRCACGLTGPALTEIGRAARQEVKGCGGVMASVRA